MDGADRVMVDDEWTDLASCQVSKTPSHRIGAKTTTIFLYFGRSPEIGVLGRSGSSWFKRSASLCPVDGGGGAPVDSAPAVWTELQSYSGTNPPTQPVWKRWSSSSRTVEVGRGERRSWSRGSWRQRGGRWWQTLSGELQSVSRCDPALKMSFEK